MQQAQVSDSIHCATTAREQMVAPFVRRPVSEFSTCRENRRQSFISRLRVLGWLLAFRVMFCSSSKYFFFFLII